MNTNYTTIHADRFAVEALIGQWPAHLEGDNKRILARLRAEVAAAMNEWVAARSLEVK